MTVIYTAQNEAPVKKSGITLLPLLVVLFIISYAILTLLVVEQGRTIEAQRGLVRELMKDSTELASLRVKINREKASRSHAGPSAAEPKNPTASPDANTGQEKPAPNEPGKTMKPRGKSRATKDVPTAPAADLQDVRRAKRVI